jgi:hypothetical protein
MWTKNGCEFSSIHGEEGSYDFSSLYKKVTKLFILPHMRVMGSFCKTSKQKVSFL